MNEIIKIENLSFGYNGEPVLNDINLSVQEHDFLGIVGPNGSGKTTLLKLILGLLEPDTGKVTIYNRPVAKARDMIGYVPQYSEMDKNFPINALDVVKMGLCNSSSYFPFRKKKVKEVALKAMRELSVENLAYSRFGELSGGQKQRVLIARALASHPRLLILDEPTASVDSSVEEDFYELLKKINSEITIILVSHDLGFISSYVNKVACVNKSLICHDINEIKSSDIIGELYHTNTSMIKHKCGI